MDGDALAQALARGERARGAYVVAFVKRGWRFVDVNHAGILLAGDGAALVREACRLRRRSVELDMARYLAGQKEFLDGIMIARIRWGGRF